jgi:hypothetical protein
LSLQTSMSHVCYVGIKEAQPKKEHIGFLEYRILYLCAQDHSQYLLLTNDP